MASSPTTAIRTGTDRVVVALIVTAGLALMLEPGWSRWLGCALVLGALLELRRFFPSDADAPWRRRVKRAIPYAIVAIAFCGLFWEPLLGRPPATRDHGIHYYQIHLLFTELLPSGRTWGWSPSLGAGYPFGESYPTLGYALFGLMHVASFGLVDERAAYAWGFAATWALGTLAVGLFARTITDAAGARSVRGDWAFCVAALLWLFDAGASRQGGWNYVVFHGVWPQMLSATLWTLSLTLTSRALQRPSPRRLSLAAFALGGSVLAHPFGLLAAACSAFFWLVALRVSVPADTVGRMRSWAWLHAGAVVVSLGGVVVFLNSASGMARSPVPWSPLGELSYEVVTGTLFPTHWAWLGPLFLLGIAMIVRRPSRTGILAVLVVAALLLLGSHEAMTVLRLDLLVSSFKNLQFPRYSIELKPIMFAIAGAGATGLWAAVCSIAPEHPPSRGRWWLAAAVAAPFVVSLGEDIGRFQTRPVGAIDTLQSSPHETAERELLAALREQASTLPEQTPLTVAFFRGKMGGGTYPIYSITDAGGTLVLDGHVPAVNFKHRVRRTPAAYDALGVTHVVHDRELGDNEQRLNDRLDVVGRFGDYTLARYRIHTPGAEIRVAQGTAQVLRSEAEHLAATISASGPTRVTVARAPHLRWAASFDGEPIEASVSKRIPGLTLMSLEVPGSGRLELHYQRSRFELFTGWLSLLGCVAGLGALAFSRPIVWRPRPQIASGTLAGLSLVVVVVTAATIARVQQKNLEKTWQHLAAEAAYPDAAAPEDDGPASARATLVRDLSVTGDVVIRRDPPKICDGIMGKDVLPGCSEAEHAPTAATLYRAPYLYRCVEFSVPPGGTAQIHLKAGGHDVAGVLTRRLLGSSGSRLRFGLNRPPKLMRSDSVNFFVAAKPAAEAPVATLLNGGRHLEKFCIAAAALRAPQP